MIMKATVVQVNPGNLFVNDSETGDDVMVHFQTAGQFSVGDNIKITYNGKITRSIPPQISAITIQRLRPNVNAAGSIPSETRAVIIQKNQSSLLVRKTQDNGQLLVNYPYANHFCVGQQITIRYDTILMNDPPEVKALEITPVC